VVRVGPVVIAALAVALAIGAKASGAPPEPREPSPGSLPYKIDVSLIVEPETRIDSRSRDRILSDWLALTDRFVGAPWDLTIAKEQGTALTAPLESLDAKAFAPISAERDKVWVIRVEREQAGYSLSGREFDVASGRLGPTLRRLVPIVADLPRGLLDFALALFCPIASVEDQSGGGVTLSVRGASIEPASPVGRVVAPGSVFEPVRLVSRPDGSTRIMNLPFTYLRVESVDGATARCAIVSALRDPLTRRIARKNRLIALGVKPADRATRLRFVTRPDKLPAAGYVLTARTLPDGPPREVGTTDRQGRIVLEPGFASGLVALRLLAGSVEPMVELPMMPGESAAERTIPFDPRPATVTLEAQLDSLRDAVIDLVAVRARLEARLKARAEGDDWPGVEATLKEFDKLTPRSSLATKLTKLKDDAARQQAESKTAILTKTAQAQIAEVQALLDRYLDDDVIRGYTEALQASRDEAAAKAKADARKKAAARPRGTP
jgi:hypothetical protein